MLRSGKERENSSVSTEDGDSEEFLRSRENPKKRGQQGATMKLVRTEKELNTNQKRFCQEYLYGEHQGNGTKCYQLAYSLVGKVLDDDSAGSCASALLKDPRITAHLKAEREKQAAELQHKLRPWSDLAGEAQQTVLDTLRGTCRSRMKYDSALHILDRALGKPVQRAETEFSLNPDGILTALHALAGRRLLGDGG